jgi:hypothetical protein
MSSNTSVTRAAALAYVQAIIAGTLKHFPSGNFTLGGSAFTTASLVALLTELANAMSALIAAHANVKDAVAALASVESKVGPVLRAYVKLVRAAFNTATQSLGDFGLQPPKARTPRTSEQNAAAAAKAKATRAARGTTSKKQKLAVKGNVTGVTVTPVVNAPAATSPSAEQAPNAPAATPPTAGGSAPKQ